MSSNEQNDKPTKTTKKNNKSPPGVLTSLVLILIFYAVGIHILLSILSAIFSEEFLDSFENLFTPKDSSIRNYLNTIQYFNRASIVGLTYVVGCILLLISVFFCLGGLILYLVLSAPLAEVDLLVKHKPSLLLIPLCGFPVGMFLLWPDVDNMENGFLSFLVTDSVSYGYLVLATLAFCMFGLYSVGNKECKKEEAERKKKEKELKEKNFASDIASEIANTVADAKIGTATYDGGAQQEDITVKDAANFIKSATETRAQRVAAAVKGLDENIYFSAARFCFGIIYGFVFRLLMEFMIALFWPMIQAALFGGRESLLMIFLKEGFRASGEYLAKRDQQQH